MEIWEISEWCALHRLPLLWKLKDGDGDDYFGVSAIFGLASFES